LFITLHYSFSSLPTTSSCTLTLRLLTMGGGNAQKSAAARLKNLKDAGKTDAQRKEASDKAKKDAQAFKCAICMNTFMVNVKPPTLYLHVTSKHPTVTNPAECFVSLAGYDPDDPTGAKKAEAAKLVGGVKKPKKKKKKEEEIDLLSIGLTKGKTKKKR